MKYPVAIQLFSVRDEIVQNFYGTLKKIKQLGYDGVEFAGLLHHTVAEMKEMCGDVGLIPISAHVPYTGMIADPEGVLGSYAELGCRFVAIPYLEEEFRPGAEQFPEVAKNIQTFGRIAKKYGMTLAYHNHDFEFEKIDGKNVLDLLYEAIPADALETELDTCWVKVGGEDPADYLRKYAGRSGILHLKDYVGEKTGDILTDFHFTPVGHGKLDFQSILKAADQSGVKWLVVEQDSPLPGKTPLECAAMSIEYLKGTSNYSA